MSEVSPHKVFISHINEEAAMGAVIKRWIEEVFRERGILAFLSSDIADLPAGRRWIDVIEGALQGSRVLISVISPKSLQRAWINIELGAALTRRMHVIPLCHHGSRSASLPRPFQDFNGVDVDSPNSARRLIGGVADGLQLPPNPSCDLAQMQNEILSVAQLNQSTGAAAQTFERIPADEENLLRFFAREREHGIAELTLDSIIQALPVKRLPTEVLLNRLQSKGMLARALSLSSPTTYFLTATGLDYLMHRPPY